jgi:hypothetical protein
MSKGGAKQDRFQYGTKKLCIKEECIVSIIFNVGIHNPDIVEFSLIDSGTQPQLARIGSETYFSMCEELRNKTKTVEVLLQEDYGLSPAPLSQPNYKDVVEGIESYLNSANARAVYVQGLVEACSRSINYIETVRKERKGSEAPQTHLEARKIISILSDVSFWNSCARIFSALNLNSRYFSRIQVEDHVLDEAAKDSIAPAHYQCNLRFALDREPEIQKLTAALKKKYSSSSFGALQYVEKSPGDENVVFKPLSFFHNFFNYVHKQSVDGAKTQKTGDGHSAPSPANLQSGNLLNTLFKVGVKTGDHPTTKAFAMSSRNVSKIDKNRMNFSNNDHLLDEEVDNMEGVEHLEDVSVISISASESSDSEFES